MNSAFEYKWKVKLKYDKEIADAEKRKQKDVLGQAGGGNERKADEMSAVEKERENLKKRSMDFLK